MKMSRNILCRPASKIVDAYNEGLPGQLAKGSSQFDIENLLKRYRTDGWIKPRGARGAGGQAS